MSPSGAFLAKRPEGQAWRAFPLLASCMGRPGEGGQWLINAHKWAVWKTPRWTQDLGPREPMSPPLNLGPVRPERAGNRPRSSRPWFEELGSDYEGIPSPTARASTELESPPWNPASRGDETPSRGIRARQVEAWQRTADALAGRDPLGRMVETAFLRRGGRLSNRP